jgi:hypothetical protein
MAKIKKAQMGYRVKGEGRSCGIERQARKDERMYERENRKATRQGEREVKREERQAKREERKIPKQRSGGSTPAWQRKEGKNPSGGLNAKGRASYNRANPGKPGLKAPQPEGGSRKKSFCARMSGMKKKLTSSKTANDPNSRINKSLRKWKC